MRKFLGTAVIVIIVMSFVSCMFMVSHFQTSFHMVEEHAGEPSILFLKLDGIILQGGEFLDDLREYSKQKEIKGVLIQVDSPGESSGRAKRSMLRSNRCVTY